jgi:hypothetical protein
MSIRHTLKKREPRITNDGKSQSTGNEYESALQQLSTHLEMPEEFIVGLAGQIFDFCTDGERVNHADVSFFLVHLLTSKPSNQTEAMLRVQHVGLHIMTLKFGKRLRFAQGPAEADSVERIYTRLARTFVAQCEALNHSATARKGTVVKVSHGSQAIVGDVTQAMREQPLHDVGLATAPLDQTSKPAEAAVRNGSAQRKERVRHH